MQTRGNALFLILICIALFAALSYAVSRSGRGEGNISRETVSLKISEVLQMMTQIQQAVQRLVILGCPKTGISYEGALTATGVYTNNNPPNDGTCDVFNPVGGGLLYRDPPPQLLDPAYSANTDYGRMKFLRNFKMIAAAMEGSEINYTHYILIPYISDEVCIAMNRQLYQYNALPQNTVDTIGLNNTFTGTYQNGSAIGCNINSPPVGYSGGGSPCGMQTGCFSIGTLDPDGLTNVNVIYHAVIRNAP